MKTSSAFSDKNLQLYGFALGSTSHILYRLRNIDCCYLVFPNNLNMYLGILVHDQPSHILGIGLYGNPYCDVVNLEIRQLINQHKLLSNYTFIYVPKTLKSQDVSREIDDMIFLNKLPSENVVMRSDVDSTDGRDLLVSEQK